jgi:flagellar hook protein FlgE
MGLYSSMRTSASGMNAQSNRISSVADNIANSNTTGYKRSSIEFSTMVLSQGGGDYQSGSVNSRTQYHITQQGAQLPTSRWSNASINGSGFFVVQDAGGQTYFTRAGAFVPTEGDGYLENAAGMRLLGYPITNGQTPPPVLNGTAGLQQIMLSSLALQSTPSTAGTFKTNLPINQDDGTATPIVAAANLPGSNEASGPATPTKGPTSMQVIDNLGNTRILDIYATRTGADTWEIAVFDASGRATGADFFPYAASAVLGSDEFQFDASGNLDTSGPTNLTLNIPNGASFTLDMSTMSAKAAPYAPEAKANGNAPSAVKEFQIEEDGTLYAVYETGARVATYRIPLADVPSADMMSVQPGVVFLATQSSGDFSIGFAQEGGLGRIDGYSVEQSTVDLASELTTMIEAQRNYTANSKVFQTSAELMDVLVNLQR